MVDEITLSIDGQEVKTQPGKMIIEAAMDAGKYIPYLCYYPGMKAFGACRMCVVKFEEGGPGFLDRVREFAVERIEISPTSP